MNLESQPMLNISDALDASD
jgi:MFS family permease